jgi:hypothetical protein
MQMSTSALHQLQDKSDLCLIWCQSTGAHKHHIQRKRCTPTKTNTILALVTEAAREIARQRPCRNNCYIGWVRCNGCVRLQADTSRQILLVDIGIALTYAHVPYNRPPPWHLQAATSAAAASAQHALLGQQLLLPAAQCSVHSGW